MTREDSLSSEACWVVAHFVEGVSSALVAGSQAVAPVAGLAVELAAAVSAPFSAEPCSAEFVALHPAFAAAAGHTAAPVPAAVW